MTFLLISVAIIGVLYGYCGWRLIPTHLPTAVGVTAWGGLALLALLTHIYHLVLRDAAADSRLADLVAWTAYTTLALGTLMFSMLVVRDLAWVLYLGVSRVLEYAGDTATAPERRDFLIQASNLGIVGLATVTTGIGVFEARRRPRVVDITVPIRGLPPALHGFRIAQICDLHVGPTIKRPFVEAVVETVNALEADLVAVVGDLVDGSVERLRPQVSPLAALRSRHGTFFVTGNHEYYSGVSAWLPEIRRLGMDVLLNEHRVIEHDGGRLSIAGVPDYSAADMVPQLPAHAHDPEAAFRGAPDGEVRLLLAHQPRSLSAAQEAGFDLLLCGHTHGGQFLPWHGVVSLQQPYVAGLHAVGDSSWIYVSRGTGYWGPPVRVSAPSEVTCITLQTAV